MSTNKLANELNTSMDLPKQMLPAGPFYPDIELHRGISDNGVTHFEVISQEEIGALVNAKKKALGIDKPVTILFDGSISFVVEPETIITRAE